MSVVMRRTFCGVICLRVIRLVLAVSCESFVCLLLVRSWFVAAVSDEECEFASVLVC